jgi:lipopolysaccharide export LptBFGC system permease protein LptF
MLAPSALSLAIPVAVLLGILAGLGRVSADREFVAMQACGVSLLRLMRPVAIVAVVATAVTAYEIIVALPGANQAFRELAAAVMTGQVERDLKPRVFFEGFPNRVIYVRDVPLEGGWRDVFVGDLSRPGSTTVYFARTGRINVDREKQLVQLQLTDGTLHTTKPGQPEAYESTRFESFTIALDPQSVFTGPPPKGAPEKTIAELRQTIAEAEAVGDPAYDARFMIQYKRSFPTTCLVLAVIGLALGASSQKGGRLASFALGLGVLCVYYVLLYGARAVALGGGMTPEWAPWIPNIIMSVAAAVMLAWRMRSADQPIRLSIPAFWRRAIPAAETNTSPIAGPRRPQVVVVIRLPHLNLPKVRVLDWYVARQYLGGSFCRWRACSQSSISRRSSISWTSCSAVTRRPRCCCGTSSTRPLSSSTSSFRSPCSSRRS